ncbi:unnamed protein product [Prorocentrum cordatum]|uniref:Cyclin-dependent kinase 2 homolog n=1 Tax=Prorocentrum cordatum TaxID=2364126 RepID=A0ABN9WXA9_9DINO|nr:unnamed protein product [Polarella glacialis]
MACWRGAACAEEAHGPLGAAASGLAPQPEGLAGKAFAGAGGSRALDACSTRAGSPEATPEPDAEEPDGAGVAELHRYEVMHVIGTGVYGTVFVARDRETDSRVAIKSLTIDDDQGDGVPAHVIREVSLLRDFVHPNIVELKDLQVNGPTEYQLIFEYVPDDLHRILKGHRREGTQLLMEEVLRYSQDLLNGIHACHARMIIHRDLKPQNLLIHPVDGLKICDVGLARIFSLPVKSYTKEVITLWYRGPELLLGHPSYGPEVDIWSAGCIIAETATGYPIFPGDSEIGTILKIMQLLGSPTEATWPGFETSLPFWSSSYPSWPPTNLQAIRDKRPELGDAGMDLVRSLLAMRPAARPTSRRARAHAFVSRPGPA